MLRDGRLWLRQAIHAWVLADSFMAVPSHGRSIDSSQAVQDILVWASVVVRLWKSHTAMSCYDGRHLTAIDTNDLINMASWIVTGRDAL